jgi:hypothetical protein
LQTDGQSLWLCVLLGCKSQKNMMFETFRLFTHQHLEQQQKAIFFHRRWMPTFNYGLGLFLHRDMTDQKGFGWPFKIASTKIRLVPVLLFKGLTNKNNCSSSFQKNSVLIKTSGKLETVNPSWKYKNCYSKQGTDKTSCGKLSFVEISNSSSIA